jgi:Organic solute transporter Ostalpha
MSINAGFYCRNVVLENVFQNWSITLYSLAKDGYALMTGHSTISVLFGNSEICRQMSLDNGYLYISCVNLVSTVVAYYGLTVLRGALRQELEEKFSVTGKILSLQLTLLLSAIPNLFISILVSTDVIQCGALYPSKARGEGKKLPKTGVSYNSVATATCCLSECLSLSPH